MTIQVQQLQNRTIVYERGQPEELRVRLSLFTASSFQRLEPVRFADGTGIVIPSMSENDRETVSRLFGRVPTDRQAALQIATDRLAEAVYAEGKSNPDGLKVGKMSQGLTAAFAEAAAVYNQTTQGGSIEQTMQGTMYMGIVGIEGKLANFALNIRGKLKLANELRTDITELRTAVADWPPGTEKQHFSWNEVSIDKDGNIKVTPKEGDLTKEEAQKLADKLDEQKQSLTEMTEMDKFDLQNMTQDYQQAVNTFADILKNNHETLRATINNLKA